MSQHKQALFRVRVKTRLAQVNRTITDVAEQINYPRSTVSQCIHHGRFPKVRRKLEIALFL